MTPSEFTDARLSLGHTKKSLAKEWGVSRQAVWYWEKGKRPIPPLAIWAINRMLRDSLAGRIKI